MQVSEATWRPQRLFRNGQEGALYDPAVNDSVYQDSGGAIPADIGDPVALMLDIKSGSGLGPQINTDPFVGSDPGAWIQSTPTRSDYLFASSQCTVTNANNGSPVGFGAISLNAGFEVGKTYQIIYDLDAVSNSLQISYSTGPASGSTIIAGSSTLGTNSFIFEATLPNPYLNFVVNIGTVGAFFTVSNISIKEVLGNRATQSTDADRPIRARQPVSGIRNLCAPANLPSEDFTNIGYTKTGSTIVPGAYTSPDGLVASKLVEDTSTGSHKFFAIFSLLALSGQNVIAFLVRNSGDLRYAQIRLNGIGLNRAYANFDLSDGSVTLSGGTSLTSAFSIPDNDDRYFLCLSVNDGATYGAELAVIDSPTAPENDSYTGDGSSGFYVYNFQPESGTEKTSYQKVVSQYDVSEQGVSDAFYLDFNGANQFMTIPGSASTFKFMHDGNGGSFGGSFIIEDDGSNSDFFSSRISLSQVGIRVGWLTGTNNLRTIISNGTTNIANISSSNNSFPEILPSVCRIQFETSDLEQWINGVLDGSSSPVSPSVLDSSLEMELGANGASSVELSGKWFGGLFIAEFLSVSDGKRVDGFYAQKSGAILS